MTFNGETFSCLWWSISECHMSWHHLNSFFFYIVQYFRVNHTSRLVCGRVEIREKIYIDYLNL